MQVLTGLTDGFQVGARRVGAALFFAPVFPQTCG